jgi:hypothetical protein
VSYPSHRYYRARAVTAGGSGYFSVSEMELRATPGGANIATGGTPLESGNYAPNPASSAFDSNYSTFWASSGGGIGDYIGYDFGVAKTVAEVAISARNDSFYTQIPSSCAIDGSDDGTTWTLIVQRDSIPWVQSNGTTSTAQLFTLGSPPPVNSVDVTGAREYAIAGPSNQIFVPAVRQYLVAGPVDNVFVATARQYVIEGPPPPPVLQRRRFEFVTG